MKMKVQSRSRWLICAASFFYLGIGSCIRYSYTILLEYLVQNYANSYTRFQLSLPGALSYGLSAICSAQCAGTVNRLGPRYSALIGTLLCSLGIGLSCFSVQPETFNVYLMCITFGLIAGIGFSFVTYVPLAILPEYFEEGGLGLASGIVTVGESLFGMILPLVLPWVIVTHGLAGGLLFLAITMAIVGLFAIIYVERSKGEDCCNDGYDDGRQASCCSTILNLFNDKSVLLVTLNFTLVNWCNYSLHAHFVSCAAELFPDSNSNLLLTIYCFFALCGNILFGKLCDTLSCVTLQLIPSLGLTVVSSLLPFSPTWLTLVTLSSVYGVLDGAICTLYTPILVELVGTQKSLQLMGLTMALSIIPETGGPAMTGYLYDLFGSYKVPFNISAIVSLISAIVLLPLFCSNRPNESKVAKYEPLSNKDFI